MRHFALTGTPLTHSYSKSLFDAQHFAEADYRLCPLPSLDGLRRWVEQASLAGFNVTAPYKQAIVPLLDELSPAARAIGAVNCVAVHGGRLVGHNTDAPAFRQTLEALLNTKHLTPTTALILGTGGAARAVAYALGQLGIPYSFVSRHPEHHPHAIGYNQLSASHLPLPALLVNATPVGTFPAVDQTPLDLTHTFTHPLSHPSIVYDLVYNPSPTLLLQQAAQRGAHTKDGLEMLHLQARLSWQIWRLV